VVELRIAVDDAIHAHGLMRRLSALFGRSAISFDRSRNEVRVESEWESRAVVQVFDIVDAWSNEDGGKGATLAIGNRDAIRLWHADATSGGEGLKPSSDPEAHPRGMRTLIGAGVRSVQASNTT
jgi:hypothetical protein